MPPYPGSRPTADSVSWPLRHGQESSPGFSVNSCPPPRPTPRGQEHLCVGWTTSLHPTGNQWCNPWHLSRTSPHEGTGASIQNGFPWPCHLEDSFSAPTLLSQGSLVSLFTRPFFLVHEEEPWVHLRPICCPLYLLDFEFQKWAREGERRGSEEDSNPFQCSHFLKSYLGLSTTEF